MVSQSQNSSKKLGDGGLGVTVGADAAGVGVTVGVGTGAAGVAGVGGSPSHATHFIFAIRSSSIDNPYASSKAARSSCASSSTSTLVANEKRDATPFQQKICSRCRSKNSSVNSLQSA